MILPKRFAVLPVILLFLAGCAVKAPVPGEILDLRALPQEAGHYIHGRPETLEFISPRKQEILGREYLEAYFAPWDADLQIDETETPIAKIRRFEGRTLYGENLLPRPEGWLDDMKRRMEQGKRPSTAGPAISVLTCSLRMLPSQRPLFYSPGIAGEGFPFDYLQDSLLPAGTPLLVTHVSSDRGWYFVKSPWLSGWVRSWEIARVDDDLMSAYRSLERLAFVQDEVPVIAEEGGLAFYGRVGMTLPLAPAGEGRDMEGRVAVMIPLRGTDGRATLNTALVPEEAVRPWPVPATGKDLTLVIDALLSKPYGWGGLYENRDCSALIQDIFAPFALYLPRNSGQQALAGDYISLSDMSREEKEALIISRGKAMTTLLNMPGHVMLYLGPDPASGRPVVLHSLWGLRTRVSGVTGRWIIGRTVITGLSPGAELPHLVRPEGLLIERITGMTLIGE